MCVCLRVSVRVCNLMYVSECVCVCVCVYTSSCAYTWCVTEYVCVCGWVGVYAVCIF